IQDLRRRPTGSLAYGLRKRVELGRALALDPKILLLDEPMGGMNQEEKEDMARFILDVNEEWGTTIILIEHDMGVVMDISDRIAVHNMGAKIAEGTPDEVRANQLVIKANLGEAKAAPSGASRGCRAHDSPPAPAQRPPVPRARGHPREGSRDLAIVHVARVPRPRPRLRPRAGRAGVRARRSALRDRRHPSASVLGPDRRPVPRRRLGARLPGLDR